MIALTPIERRIRLASLIILGGLVAEAVSFLWHSPLSMLLFMVLCPIVVLGGIVFYLLTLLKIDRVR